MAPVQRRIFHLCASSLFPVLVLFFPRLPLLAAAGGLLALSLVGEGLRLRYAPLNRLFLSSMRLLLKGREDRTLLGSTYVLTSTVVALGTMTQPVAALALFYTSVADPLAALVGERLGAHRLWGKSAEGSAAFLAGALAMGALLLATGLETTFPVMLVGAIAATLLELLPLPLDDNLKVPLGSGGVMMLVAQFWA